LTDRELKKLDKTELLQILIDLSDENEALRKENDALSKENAVLQSRQYSPRPQSSPDDFYIHDNRSVSEMSRRVGGVFEAAQGAADEYLNAIMSLKEHMDADYRRIIDDAMRQADMIIKEAEKEKENRIAEAKTYCKEMSDRFKSINKNFEIINRNFEYIKNGRENNGEQRYIFSSKF